MNSPLLNSPPPPFCIFPKHGKTIFRGGVGHIGSEFLLPKRMSSIIFMNGHLSFLYAFTILYKKSILYAQKYIINDSRLYLLKIIEFPQLAELKSTPTPLPRCPTKIDKSALFWRTHRIFISSPMVNVYQLSYSVVVSFVDDSWRNLLQIFYSVIKKLPVKYKRNNKSSSYLTEYDQIYLFLENALK